MCTLSFPKARSALRFREGRLKVVGNTKTLMITGSGGFLGGNLIPVLLDRGHRVIAVSGKTMEELGERFGESLTGQPIEVVHPSARGVIAGRMTDVDILISCAFPRHVDGRGMARGLEFINWLLRVGVEQNVGAVVNISSQSVYDPCRNGAAYEGDAVCPQGGYAVAKYAVELMVDTLFSNISHTSVRLASLIGPGFDQRVVNKLVVKALAGEQLVVRENGSEFGFLDVKDAVHGLVLLVESDSARWNSIYNLGPDSSATLTEIANEVVRACGRAGAPVFEEPLVIEAASEERKSSSLDSGQFKVQFGWACRYSLVESIQMIIDAKTISEKGSASNGLGC